MRLTQVECMCAVSWVGGEGVGSVCPGLAERKILPLFMKVVEGAGESVLGHLYPSDWPFIKPFLSRQAAVFTAKIFNRSPPAPTSHPSLILPSLSLYVFPSQISVFLLIAFFSI